jgi:murein DD-endopeptidase MepM/ murein hydrolase activator NlpD
MSARMRRHGTALVILAASLGSAHLAAAAPFTYAPPGQLVTGSGTGRVDSKVYAPGIRFPLESGPAFAHSQVWSPARSSGGDYLGTQCKPANFEYPWHDNYCETRDWDMPLCPSGNGHQGQDIRAATCEKGVHWVVAVIDGTITSIGSYSVYLTAADGTRFDYLHMQDVQVKEGQKLKRGDRVGKVGREFGTNGETTVHLHFNIKQNVAGIGSVYVPTYLSLVSSYETLLDSAKDAGLPEAAPPPPPVVAETPVPGPPADQPAAEPDDGCTFAGTTRPAGDASFAALAAFVALVFAVRRRART